MSQSRRASRAPWITAAIAGVVLVALAIVFFAVLLPYRRDHHPGGTPRAAAPTAPVGTKGSIGGQFTADEKAAITAAGVEGANLLSYSRADFDADFARALAGATGKLKSDIVTRKSITKTTLTNGNFDLSATVSHTALVGPTDSGNGYVVIVTVNGYKSTALDIPNPQNLTITVVKIGGKWLASDAELAGIQ